MKLSGGTPLVLDRPGGRPLAVCAYGPEGGHPVLYMHGTPSAHSEWEMFGTDAQLEAANLRIIAPDRPGMGASGFQRDRRLSDWPSEARAIADALGLSRLAVFGYSGGGPYAVAAALALADRVSALALVAPVVHATPEMTEGLDSQGLKLKEAARQNPFVTAIILQLAMGLPARFAPGSLERTILKTLPRVDAEAISENDRMQRFLATLRDAFRHGSKGATQDMGLMVSPWDIELKHAPFPVHIWQGSADNFGARPAMAVYLAEALGATDLRLEPEGHISIFTRNIDAILEILSSSFH